MKKFVTLFVLVLATSVAFGQVADLFFSEYIEGGSSNKAIEIYNGTGAEVDLANYQIAQSVNGGGWEYFHTFPTGATIADGDVWVIVNKDVASTLYDTLNADEVLAYPSVVHHNGDDARAMIKIVGTDTTWLDIIGDPNTDPGTGWNVAGVTNATADHSLVRKENVFFGNTNWTASAGTHADTSEWIVLAKDVFDSLGTHTQLPFNNVTFTITDSTFSYQKIMIKGEMTGWGTVQCYDDGANGGDVTADDHIWTVTLVVDTGTYEWGAIEDDGSQWGIWLIEGPNKSFTVAEDGTVTGQTSYIIPPPGEQEYLVTFVLNTSKMDNITDSTVVSTMVSGSYDGWKHDDSLTIDGDYCSITIPILGHPTNGVDFAFKHWYIDAVGTQNWESVSDRNVTVTSDTTFLTYWNNDAPFVPTDSVDVWFRVNMAGVPDYDGTSPVMVRGSDAPLPAGFFGGIELTKEGDSDYYSNLISFANDSAEQTVLYKFVWGALSGWDNVHWEQPKYETQEGNRYFVLSQDTTLAFKYFSDEPPTEVEPQTAYIVFSVDMAAYIELGLFSEARKDSMQIRGTFNGWNDGDPLKSKMTKQPGTTVYSIIAEVTDFPGKEIQYKYYMKMSQESLTYWANQGITDIHVDWGYEVPPTRGGGNRLAVFEGDPSNYQILDLAAYNGLALQGIIPAGHTVPVTFTIDMNAAPLFNAATDSVLFYFKDEWQVNALGHRGEKLKYTDANSDGIYEITIDFVGPTAYTLIYTVGFEGLENSIEEGGGFEFGRFRCRYIQPTTKDPVTWPAAYSTPMDTFTEDPPLDVETPPLGVLKVEDEDLGVPERFALSQNYPNPFNPTTSIRFTIPRSEIVTLTIYNMLGQIVTKVVYDNLQVGNYTYMWNGTDLHGNSVASGVYFYELNAGNQFRDIKKMVLMK